ncbi:unnamed protein product [Mytilus coruscus]|uniref:C-type lectin domain-containing protein n=1 Tax=Mytilus coruscus TaxID=42192 RepID=A0A6J8CYL9_MYTCO|nr:unnamed protein product [Mytilus coruscus]
MVTFRIDATKRILSNRTSAIVRSTLGCAFLCTIDPICCSASYEEEIKSCLLENLYSPEKENRPNSMTMSKITGCEFEGYFYDTISHACLKLAKTTGSTWTSARTTCQQDGGTESVWIGLRARKWMTGDSFHSFYKFPVHLNDFDAVYPQDTDKSCGCLIPNQNNLLRDDSCNIHIKTHFVCEIIL